MLRPGTKVFGRPDFSIVMRMSCVIAVAPRSCSTSTFSRWSSPRRGAQRGNPFLISRRIPACSRARPGGAGRSRSRWSRPARSARAPRRGRWWSPALPRKELGHPELLLRALEDAAEVDLVELDRRLVGDLDRRLGAIGFLGGGLEGLGHLEAHRREGLRVGSLLVGGGRAAVNAGDEADEDPLGQVDVRVLGGAGGGFLLGGVHGR